MRLLGKIIIIYFGISISYSLACGPLDTDLWDKSIVPIMQLNQNDSTYATIGTGFFIYSYDPHCYAVLISNKHVLKSNAELFIRVKLKPGFKDVSDTVSLDKYFNIKDNLISPLDTAVDLAAVLVCKKEDSWDIGAAPKSKFQDIGKIIRGTEIYYLGFPNGISFSNRIAPVYRQGCIALDAEYYNGLYLIDAMSIRGSSGSPIFDCFNNLLGIMKGYVNIYEYDEHKYEVVSDSINVDGKVLANSGLGAIIPINHLNEFMTQIDPNWRKR